MEHETFFDAGDNTALVCVDNEQYQKAIVPQLIETKYKVHLGATEEDVLSKLRAHSYDIVVIYENFKGTALGTNPILREMIHRPGAQRRDHFVVLLTHRLASNDAMSAFVQSVDLIVNVADLTNFKVLLRRGVAQHRDLYHPFVTTWKAAQGV